MARVSIEEYIDKPKAPIEGIVDYLVENPRPTDEQVHQWAEDNGHKPDEVEEYLYRLVSGMARRMSKSLNIPDVNFKEEELNKGVEVEQEHTDSPAIAKMIAKDHLLECPTYYTALDKMEKRCDTPTTESLVDGKRRRELEYTFYGKLADMSQLQKAIRKEDQEQWLVPIETQADAKMRIRAIDNRRWVLTTKFKYEGRTGVEETECDISKDMFDDLKMIATGGMRKTRYEFKVEGSEILWEVDVFKDAEGRDHPWVKFDLEVSEPLSKFPPLPVDVIKGEFIARQKKQQTPEEKAKIDSLWKKEWTSLDENQRLTK